MIDLTPLDVRKKSGDFRRRMRGYDPDEVGRFLELVATRLEEVVKENLRLRERVDGLTGQVEALEGREKAVHEALVSAQQLRDQLGEQARREAELTMREAEEDARTLRREAEEDARARRREAHEAARLLRDEADRAVEEKRDEIRALERVRTRFLAELRGLLERGSALLEEAEGAPVPAAARAADAPDPRAADDPDGKPTAPGSDAPAAPRQTPPTTRPGPSAATREER